jgi:hypothetical protein
MRVERISDEDVARFWVENKHWEEGQVSASHDIRQLGHFKNHLVSPKRIAYGLFDKKPLIGVTMMYEWNSQWVRYRTIHLLTSYRKKGLSHPFLRVAYDMDWKDKSVFGWVRQSHYDWSIKAGFEEIDGVWNESHIGMLLSPEGVLKLRSSFSW